MFSVLPLRILLQTVRLVSVNLALDAGDVLTKPVLVAQAEALLGLEGGLGFEQESGFRLRRVFHWKLYPTFGLGVDSRLRQRTGSKMGSASNLEVGSGLEQTMKLGFAPEPALARVFALQPVFPLVPEF